MQKMVRTKVKGDTACSDDRKERIKNRHNEISTNLNKMRALEALKQAQPLHLPNGHACLPGSKIAKIGDQEKK